MIFYGPTYGEQRARRDGIDALYKANENKKQIKKLKLEIEQLKKQIDIKNKDKEEDIK